MPFIVMFTLLSKNASTEIHAKKTKELSANYHFTRKNYNFEKNVQLSLPFMGKLIDTAEHEYQKRIRDNSTTAARFAVGFNFVK